MDMVYLRHRRRVRLGLSDAEVQAVSGARRASRKVTRFTHCEVSLDVPILRLVEKKKRLGLMARSRDLLYTLGMALAVQIEVGHLVQLGFILV